ncbi:MAG: TMEM14 family protein [Phormidesmis sp.]
MSYTPIAAYTTLAYGILAIVGGYMGFKQAGSQVSFFSGLISGFLLLIGAYFLFGGSPIGLTLSAIVSLVLIVVFAIRLSKTRKFMPAGLMTVLGLLNLGALWTLWSMM